MLWNCQPSVACENLEERHCHQAMKFLSSYSRLKERVRMLEKYVDELGKTNQAQQILLEKLQDKLEDGLQHKPHDKLHDKVDQLSAEVLARSLETKLLRERAQIFEDMSLARSLRPAGADAAIARLKSPCVSVILPTHNRASTLPDAIASVQAQAMGDWELIIVDDGSTDHTREVVSPFLEDKRIRYLVQDQSGSAGARNRGSRNQAPPSWPTLTVTISGILNFCKRPWIVWRRSLMWTWFMVLW